MALQNDGEEDFSKKNSLGSRLNRFKFWVWKSLAKSPMQPIKTHPSDMYRSYIQPSGLKTLIYTQQASQNPSRHLLPLIIHSAAIPSSPLPHKQPPAPPSSTFQVLKTLSSSYSSWTSGLDDMIGTESGVYMSTSNEFKADDDVNVANHHRYRWGKKNRRLAAAREFPPPIPLLARTGNLPSHMPWVLTRHYNKGRLVLKEERVRHHEYFEAHRENGRLVLNLVPLDDTVPCLHALCSAENAEELDDADGEEHRESGEKDEDCGYSVIQNKRSILIPASSSIPEPCNQGKDMQQIILASPPHILV